MNFLPCGNFLNMDEIWKLMKYGLKYKKEWKDKMDERSILITKYMVRTSLFSRFI
jgi:hypothetical protein